MPVRHSMPFQMMPPQVAAGYHNNIVYSLSGVPLVNSLSQCQSRVPFVPVPPANLNNVNHQSSVLVKMQNPFAGQPMVRFEPPPALRAELTNHDVQAQQQFLYQIAAASGNNLLHPFAVAPVPVLLPQRIPGSGTHPVPTINPVFPQSLVPARLTNERQGQVKVEDVARQQFIVNCTTPYTPGLVRTQSSLLPSEGFIMNAVSVSAGDTTMCELTLSTVTNKKQFEAARLPLSCNVNDYDATAKPLQIVSLPHSCSKNAHKTESSGTTEQLRTSSLLQTCNTNKTNVDFLFNLKQPETSLSPSAFNTLENRGDLMLSDERIQTTSLPTVECDPQFSEKELITASVFERADQVARNSTMPLHSDILPTFRWSPSGFRSRENCRKSPETSVSGTATVAGSSWSDTGDFMSFDNEDLPLGLADSEAHSLARSVRSIIEQGSMKDTEMINCDSSWLTNAVSQDEIWTKPADAKNIWNSANVNLCDSYHVSSTRQSDMLMPSVVDVGSSLGSDGVHCCDTSAADAGDQSTTNHFVTNGAESGLYDQQSIWPTAFGPFTRPSDSTSDNICRLPPGLETQVLERIGVIGQRGPRVQKSASLEVCGSSGVESVSDSSQGPVSSCGSSELPVTSSSSETVVCAPLSVETVLYNAIRQQSVVSSQEPDTTDDSMFSNTSLVMNVISAMTTQAVPRERNVPGLPNKSSCEGEFKLVGSNPCSLSYLPTQASKDDSCVTSVSSDSDADRTVKQTVTAECEMGTSQPVPVTAEQKLCPDNAVHLRDTIAQLVDIMLQKPQLIREVMRSADSCSTVCDKLAASSGENSSSLGADLAETLCKIASSSLVSSSTEPHTSVDYDNISAASRPDESSLAIEETDVTLAVSEANTCDTLSGTVVSTAGSVQTHIKYDSSLVSADASAANSHNESTDDSLVDEETGVNLPVTGASDVDSVTCSSSAADGDVSSTTDRPSLDVGDMAPVQQVLSRVAESRIESLDSSSDKHAEKCPSESSVEDLLDLVHSWKLS